MAGTPKILVVDDEPIISEMLDEVLKKKYRVDIVDTGNSALQQIEQNSYDLIITDVYLPDLNGMDILKAAKQIEPDSGVIVITGQGSVESAVHAMKAGAYDFLTKDFSLDEIEITVEKFFKFQRLVKENELLRLELCSLYGIDDIIGTSESMRRVFETVEMVAPTSATVLIYGASGTGKELIAKAIHRRSNRRDKPFIKTNCAAIPEGLVESELFGHEKGSFTGAFKSTKGRFELADGGTLLLDEISEIQSNLQAKLLRVLQEQEFERVGNPETIKVDVRIVATTNQNLREEIKKGNFREDLFYRLNVVPIELPPLKERKEDILLLAEHFIEKFAKQNNRAIKGIDDNVMKYLYEYDWPGNVRELENTMERAVVVCKEHLIQMKHLYCSHDSQNTNEEDSALPLPSGLTLRELEKRFIMQTLREQKGNRTWTADKLGISVRTLRNRLKEYAQDELERKPAEVGNN